MSKEAKSTERALKLALEALENWVEYFPQNVDDIDKKAITSLREALAEQPAPVSEGRGLKLAMAEENDKRIEALRAAEQPAQRCPLCNYQHGHAIRCKNNPVDIALDKKAENARELGLDYEPAQQEADKPTQVLQDGVAEYVDALMKGTHEITSVTIRPKRTWVHATEWWGLTELEVDECYESVMFNPDIEPTRVLVYQAIEAKLKAKNFA